ncbi:MAG: amidase family protein [Desulfobacteraceae bacterium]|jgi:amidase
MNELIRLTACDAVELLKKREISPLELVDAAVDRIRAVEGRVNALPTLCLERALERARRIQDHPPADPPDGFLYGLPIAVKDLDDVQGVRTTYGSPIFADNVPERSCAMVERLEANGAVVLAKSNTPEFGAGGHTFNEVFGTTVNPWNTSRTCGGSSGGSAVALATGEVWLATGSDVGGSLRTPAGFCSVVGLRPSPGRVPAGPGPLPFETLPVLGPMGRNVRDAALMLDAETGAHPADPFSLPRPRESFRAILDRPVRPLKIGVSPDLGLTPVDPEIRRVFEGAVSAWKDMGMDVEEIGLDLGDVPEVYHTLRARFFASFFAPLLVEHRDLIKPEVIWNTEKGLTLTGDEIGWAERGRGKIFHEIMAYFRTHDLLIHPTAITPPFDKDLRHLEEVDGHRFKTYMDWLSITFLSSLTTCPAISVPCGFTENGLPVGLQIMGPPRREDRVLQAALLFEEHLGLHAQLPIDPLGAEG